MNPHVQNRLRQEELKERAPADLVVAMWGKDPLDIPSYLLGSTGPIARSLDGYTPRAAQIQVAQSVWSALRENRTAVVEAGTGVGKSLGATVPAIAWATEPLGPSRPPRTVILSTAMKILQDQYINETFPFLEQNLGIEFKVAVLKGRGNYVCPNNVATMRGGYFERWQEFLDWYDSTETGDLGELPFEFNTPGLRRMYREITATAESCGGMKCSHFMGCPFFEARNAANQAQVIVTNHTLLTMNAWCDGKLLPHADAIIIDEAHKLEHVTRSTLSTVLSVAEFAPMWKRMMGLVEPGLKIEASISLTQLMSRLEDAYGSRIIRGQLRLSVADIKEPTMLALAKFHNAVEALRNGLRVTAEQAQDGKAEFAEAMARRLSQLLGVMRGSLQVKEEPSSVLWLERDDDDKLQLTIAPLDIGGWLARNVFTVPTVLMSATLSTTGDGDMSHFCKSVGVDKDAAIITQVDSPYSYREQARYLLPRWPAGTALPSKGTYAERTQAWVDMIAGPILQILTVVDARALCLFTSVAVMKAVRDIVQQQGPTHWTVLMQGDAGKQELIDFYKRSERPVLLATKSFFEGVDIRGEKLSCVIIDKIPFPGRDPVEEALREAAGGFPKSMGKFDIPAAIIELRQAVGRLIRHEGDRGLITLLDPRLLYAQYRNQILKALPGWVEPLSGDQLHLVRDWIDGRGPAPEYGVRL